MPALPQSIGAAGSVSPRRPAPAMRSLPSSASPTSTPSARTAASVDSVSSERPSPRISLSPSAIAPIRSARCEIDLSPGSSTPPCTDAAGSILIPA